MVTVSTMIRQRKKLAELTERYFHKISNFYKNLFTLTFSQLKIASFVFGKFDWGKDRRFNYEKASKRRPGQMKIFVSRTTNPNF